RAPGAAPATRRARRTARHTGVAPTMSPRMTRFFRHGLKPISLPRFAAASRPSIHASRSEAAVLGAIALSWLTVLAAVLTHHLYVGHDSLSNTAHIWYIAHRLWHGHGLPLRMPMLAQGKAMTYPYAFIPWTTAALLRPLLSDWVVTLWLVAGFVGLVVALFWAFPELRRGWAAAATLVNPALI